MDKKIATIFMILIGVCLVIYSTSHKSYGPLLFTIALIGIVCLIAFLMTFFEKKDIKNDVFIKTQESTQKNYDNFDEDQDGWQRCPKCNGGGEYLECGICGNSPAVFDDYDDNIFMVCLSCRREGIEEDNFEYVLCRSCGGKGKIEY